MLHELEEALAYEFEGDGRHQPLLEAALQQRGGCPAPAQVTVSGFRRYQNAVASLPPLERRKIEHIAHLIRQSFQPGCRPILNVRLVGHADRDIQRGPVFEKRISVSRARAMEQALKASLRNPRIASRIAWQPSGVGASALIVPNPRTEPERARNRRVEVFLSQRGPRPDRWDHAVKENRRLARSLGWQAYASTIMRFLGFAAFVPGDSAFASAVAAWQSRQGLNPNGIIGAQTLARIHAALQSLTSFPGDDTRPALSSQEIPPDPGVLRRLQHELQYEAGDQADKFVTEQVFGFPRGHKFLTELAAAGLPTISSNDLDALKEGNARVDDLTKAFIPSEQKRHTLRREKCQPVPHALSDARNHLIALHSIALTSVGRKAQFEMFGEALHLIQDSYSEAHTERLWGGAGGVDPIRFIRFFGFQGSCRFPREHRVVPPPDPRDNIRNRGVLTFAAKRSVAASREYLTMALRHLASPGSPSIPGELRAFMDKHLILDPGHTPTSFCYPGCPDPAAPCRCKS
jgi:outer membrane protein OmpA-like peptidoglycan-associated protein/peptidoglycan hydrolase-like protein with peptidoglycan-binding domain